MIVHLNGQLLPREQAFISPFDRGFILGDGVYEGLRAIAWPAPLGRQACARVIGLSLHIQRLRQALTEGRFALGSFDLASLESATDALLKANNLQDTFVYWQITRGTPTGPEPVRQRVPSIRTLDRAGLASGLTVFGYCTPQPTLDEIEHSGPTSKRVWVLNDPRWQMGHLKSTSLMGNCLAAIEADFVGGADAQDTILLRDGLLAEGLATNVLIVTADGRLATPSLDSTPILAGVTRALLIHVLGSEIECRPIHEHELWSAREVMLCGSSTMIQSCISLNRRPVGDCSPGPVARRLLKLLLDSIRSQRDLNLPHHLVRGQAWKGFEIPPHA